MVEEFIEIYLYIRQFPLSAMCVVETDMKCQLEYIFIIWLYVLLPCSDIVKAEPLSSDHLPCKVHKLTVHTVKISLFSKFLCCIVLRLKSSPGFKVPTVMFGRIR